MTTTSELRFNALTDPWLPLVQADDSTIWASPIEVLSGEKDGIDLDYPRDDFRVYGRLLLSALTQALFPAQDKAELVQRITTPLSRAAIEATIAPVLSDFDLFGPKPFLQVTVPKEIPDQGAAPFVFPSEDLFPSSVPVELISIPIALVMVFIEQTYAGGAGRGYGAGPGGQPGVFTLIDPGSIRAGAWANTLTRDVVARLYGADGPTPWSNEPRDAPYRSALGIVTGLFFQPRAIWLVSAGAGVCSVSGVRGALVRASPFRPKSTLGKKKSGVEDLWQHPCAPLAVNSQGIGVVRLQAERPMWTGLAQVIAPISKGKKTKHPREGVAPVLEQWKSMGLRNKRPRLLVLDFVRDKANIKRRFFEAYPLTERFLADRETAERLHSLANEAQAVRNELVGALQRAHDTRKHGGFALADAESDYWGATESPFFDWLNVATEADEWTEEHEDRLEVARAAMATALRKIAVNLFDDHVAISEFDPRKQAQIARARHRLTATLFATGGRSAAPSVPQPTEVSP